MKLYTVILFFCFSWCFCQNSLDPKQFAETITAKELKESLYVYASDYFQGRETGEIGQKRAINFFTKFLFNFANTSRKWNRRLSSKNGVANQRDKSQNRKRSGNYKRE